MGILKSFVNSRTYPEGNIVRQYGTEDVVECSMSYLDPDNLIGVPHSREVSWGWDSGEEDYVFRMEIIHQAHFLVLEHMEVVEPYVLEHKQLLVQQNPERDDAWVSKKHMKEFNNWFKDRGDVSTDVIKKQTAGPIFTVTTYQAYDING